MGVSGPSSAARAMLAESSSGITARRECGATPVRTPGQDAASRQIPAQVSTGRTKRRCPGAASAPPNWLWRYSTGSRVRPIPAASAPAAMRRAISAGSA
ncbi:hypothetical protein ROTAS13_02209 [Roseomonas sp. TAS13]|nr:hypothetical protein ROTAS13_02209 [Roseomonas sp. TAS13]